MDHNWKHVKTLFGEEPYEIIFGVDIWSHKWENTHQTVTVKGPSYGQTLWLHIYEIQLTSCKIRFAAAEVANDVWGIYREVNS